MNNKTVNPTLRISLTLSLGLGLVLSLVALLAGPARARQAIIIDAAAAADMKGNTLAPAAAITVSTTLDDLTVNGNCTLREAVQAANTDTAVDACPAGSGDDIIILRSRDYDLTLAGALEDNNATGDLDISNSLSIIGRNVLGISVIDGGGLDRIFHITTGGITVTLSDVGVVFGEVTGSGGGIRNESDATLIITNASISSNTANTSGGGLYNEAGEVRVTHTSFSSNSCIGSSSCNGGAIDNRGLLNIIDSRITNSVAEGIGGGIFTTGGSTINILDSALTSNRSERLIELGGGGLFVGWNTQANLANTTIASNRAYHDGGGILSQGYLSVTHSTVYGNIADYDGNYAGDGGGIAIDWQNQGRISIKNSLVAVNSDWSPPAEKPDIAGSITSAGYNLIGDRGTETFSSGVGDLVGITGSPIDPILDNILTGYPGYIRLLVGSPAINHIPPANCTFISTGTNPLFTNAAPVLRDLPGTPRPQGGYCDIGNNEASADSRISKTVDQTGPVAGQTINYTISVANYGVLTLTNGVISDALPAGLALVGPITLDPPAAGTVGAIPEIVTGLTIAPSSQVTITMPAQVQAGVLGGTAITNTAELTATDIITALQASVYLAVSDCQAQIDGSPAIYPTVQAAVTDALNGDLIKIAGYCAGTERLNNTDQVAYLDKDLTLQGGHPSGFGGPPEPNAYPTTLDAARFGRVFWIPGQVTVTLEDLTLRGGLVDAGGAGIYIQQEAVVTLTRVSMTKNDANSGGGVYNRGLLTISESTLTDNQAEAGGAIYNLGPLTITNSTIHENAAEYDGGGMVNQSDAEVRLENSTFENNLAGDDGGAIFNRETSELTIETSQFLGNISESSGGAIANQGILEIRGSLLVNNSAGQGDTGYGGALSNQADMLGLIQVNIISSTLIDNVSGRHGGGIYMPNGGDITITQSTLSRNQAGEDGGGIFLANDMVFGLYGRLNLINTTLSLNQAGEDGGGIWAVPQDLSIFISMTHVTLAGNESTNGTGGGIYSAYGDTSISYENTLLAGNTAGGPGIGSDCAGSGIYASKGYNLVGGGGGCPTTGTDLTVHGDIFSQVVSADLLDNGGTSLTHALFADSPAVDFVPLISCLPTDQRGVSRPVGPLCDIGAYEFARQLYLPAIRKNTP